MSPLGPSFCTLDAGSGVGVGVAGTVPVGPDGRIGEETGVRSDVGVGVCVIAPVDLAVVGIGTGVKVGVGTEADVTFGIGVSVGTPASSGPDDVHAARRNAPKASPKGTETSCQGGSRIVRIL